MINIIFEDEHIIVAIKPVGINSESEMPNLLKEETGSDYIAPVHRLDTAVSGVMVYAKTKSAAAFISSQIISGDFKKEYLAIISGEMEDTSGTLTDLLFKDSTKNKSYVVKRERRGVKKAVLSYETKDSVMLDNETISLIRVVLHTGRTHQIRVQFSSRRHSLLGDKKYGSRFQCPIALFSHKISFIHPESKEKLSFKAQPDYSKFPFNKFNN